MLENWNRILAWIRLPITEKGSEGRGRTWAGRQPCCVPVISDTRLCRGAAGTGQRLPRPQGPPATVTQAKAVLLPKPTWNEPLCSWTDLLSFQNHPGLKHSVLSLELFYHTLVKKRKSSLKIKTLKYQVQIFLIKDKKKALFSGVTTKTVIPSFQSTNSMLWSYSPHTLTHTHTQLHDVAKEKQLPQNRTFSIKETRIPLTFSLKKKKKKEVRKGLYRP